MNIALIMCPWYTGGTSPPLGLGYINGMLRELNQNTLPFDIEFLFNRDYLGLNQEVNLVFGLPAHDPRRIMFIINPELILYALFPEAFKNYSVPASRLDLITLEKIKKILRMYVKVLLKRNIDMALFSVYISNIAISLITAQIIKEKSSIPIIFGGPGVSLPEVYKFILNLGFVDGCVIGEGENTILEIIKKFTYDVNALSIPGFVTLKTINNFVPRSLISSIDDIPFPCFDNFPLNGNNLRAYLLSGKNTFIPISTSRGCIMRCAFCSESQFWKKFRQRSIESVVEEIQYQTKKYKIFNIRFNDSLTNANIEWLENLCDLIKKINLKLNWTFTYLRPTGISEKLAKKMKQAGCRFVSLGVETGSTEMRTKLRKFSSNDEILYVLKNLDKAGIKTMINILNGFPNEKLKYFLDNIKFFKEWIKCYKNKKTTIYWVPGGLLRLEPYSDLYKNPDHYKIKIEPFNIFIPKNVGFLKKYISKIAYIWKDSIPFEEKISRDNQLRKNIINSQSNFIEWTHYQNVSPKMIKRSSIFQSKNYQLVEIKKEGKDRHFLINRNRILMELDNKEVEIFNFISEKPHSVNEIYQKINNQSNQKLSLKKIKLFLTNLINFYPFPLINFKESTDMKEM